MEILLTVIFGALTALGVYLTWRYKHRPLRYSWDDVQEGVVQLLQQVRGKSGEPEIIVTVTGSGGIVANLFVKLFDKRVPVYNVMLEDPRQPWGYTPPLHSKHKAGRWLINVPEALAMESKEKNVLILDSSHFSGLTMKTLLDILEEAGFKSLQNGCLVQVEPPQGATPEPDFYAFRTADAVFYYPWGKG